MGGVCGGEGVYIGREGRVLSNISLKLCVMRIESQWKSEPKASRNREKKEGSCASRSVAQGSWNITERGGKGRDTQMPRRVGT